MMADAVQRSLGVIEGTLSQVLTEIKSLRVDLVVHTTDDRNNFAAIRNEMASGFVEADRARNQHLNEQDTKLDGLKQDADRAKGAGYVVLTMLAGLASLIGTGVVAILNGWFGLHR